MERRKRPRDGTFGARLYDAQTRWIEGRGAGDARDEPFAKAIGITATTLSPWWRADTPPTNYAGILRISAATGADPGWLAFGSQSLAPVWRDMPDQPATDATLEDELGPLGGGLKTRKRGHGKG